MLGGKLCATKMNRRKLKNIHLLLIAYLQNSKLSRAKESKHYKKLTNILKKSKILLIRKISKSNLNIS